MFPWEYAEEPAMRWTKEPPPPEDARDRRLYPEDASSLHVVLANGVEFKAFERDQEFYRNLADMYMTLASKDTGQAAKIVRKPIFTQWKGLVVT